MRTILLRLAVLSIVVVSTAYAQEGQTIDDFLLEAVHAEDSDQLKELIGQNRLEIKPALGAISALFVDARLSGDSDEAGRLLHAALTISSEFERRFGERSLSLRVGDLNVWSDAQLAIKSRADSLLAAGIEIRRSNGADAYDFFVRAEELFLEIRDVAGQAEVMGQKGYVHWGPDRAKYFEFNSRAIDLRRAVDDRQLMGNSLNDVAIFHYVRRDWESALEAFLEGEQIRWEIGDSLKLKGMLPRIGVSYEELRYFSLAEEYYQKASDLSLALGDTAASVGQRSNIALMYTQYLSRHSEAISIFLGLQEELTEINDPLRKANVLLNLGIANKKLGDYPAAIQNYRDVIRISEENGYADLYGKAQMNIGVVQMHVNRHDRAVPFFEEALAQFRYDGDRAGVADALLNLGSAHLGTGAYESSEAALSEAIAESDSLADPIRKSRALSALGNTRLRGTGPDAAIPVYEDALRISEEMESAEMTMLALFGLGDSAERAGDATTALSFYDRGIRNIEDTRGLLLADEDKAGFIAQSRYLYEDVVHFLTEESAETGETKWAETAFHFAERSKARAFLDQLAEALAGVSEGVDAELLSDKQILTENLVYYRDLLSRANPATDAAEIAEIKQAITEQEAEFERVEREMRDRNPRYADLQYPDPIDVSGVQSQLLGSGDVLLQYALGDSSSTLWVVGSDTFTSYSLPTRDDLKQQVDLVRFALTNPNQGSPESFTIPARNLYKTLIAPASAEIALAENLIIVPDGELHYLPFEILIKEDPGENSTYQDLSYLMRDFNVRYGQSASVLRQLQLQAEDRAEPTYEFLAVGDPVFAGGAGGGQLRNALQPLPFSGSEVSGIASLFSPDRSSVFYQEEATESGIKEALKSNAYRFIHFATHGLINDDRPDFSALAFSRNDDGNDGMLQSAEIFNMSINADLVVLSACETGLGRLVQGEGMVGLTRAFMYAGAPSLVVSLWSVSDASTSSLMQAFYDGMINRSDSKQQALRDAKMTLLDDPATAHPFFWAPFVLIGEGN